LQNLWTGEYGVFPNSQGFCVSPSFITVGFETQDPTTIGFSLYEPPLSGNHADVSTWYPDKTTAMIGQALKVSADTKTITGSRVLETPVFVHAGGQSGSLSPAYISTPDPSYQPPCGSASGTWIATKQ